MKSILVLLYAAFLLCVVAGLSANDDMLGKERVQHFMIEFDMNKDVVDKGLVLDCVGINDETPILIIYMARKCKPCDVCRMVTKPIVEMLSSEWESKTGSKCVVVYRVYDGGKDQIYLDR